MSAERARSASAPSLGPFRAKMLERTFAIVAPATLVAAVHRFVAHSEVLTLDPLLLRAAAALFVLWLVRGLGHRVRAVGLVVVLSIISGAGYVERGPFGPGRVLFLGVAFLSTVLLGPAGGAAVVAAAVLLFALVVPGAPADFSSPWVWVPTDVVVVLLLLAVVTPVATLLEELGASLLEARRLVARERDAQERAELAASSLAQERARMEAIVHNSTALIYVKDLEGHFLMSNRELEQALRRSKEEILGKTDYDFFDREYAETFRAHDAEVIRIGKPLRQREDAPSPTGTRRYLSTKFPVRDTRGRIYALGAISTDVSALAEMELLTLEYETIFTQAFAVCPDAIALSNADDGTFVAVNPGFCTLLACTADEAVGKTASELSLWADPAASAPILAALATSGEIRDREISIRTRTGFVKTCEVSATILEQRGARTLLTVIRDVSEKRRAEVELLKLNENLEARVTERTAALEATHRDLDTFSRAVSEDLRAPLGRISTHVEGIVRKIAGTSTGSPEADTEGRRLANVIATSAARMTTLIDDLLRFAQLGKVELSFLDVDLRTLCNEVAAELALQHPGRALEWSIGALPIVKGDPALLRQVFVNLLDNAVKYTRKRHTARIVIESETAPDGHTISVQDNGEGFDPERAHQLFNVFQRLHSDFEGTGVGLANVKRIVNRHGGTVRAEGTVGVGAKLSVVLPTKLRSGWTEPVASTDSFQK